MKEVAKNVQQWVGQKLDDPVDLEEYIDVHIHGKANKTLKPTQAQTDAKQAAANAFRSDLEDALTSWKPQFLYNKKGKMLNVISEAMAPSAVLESLTKVVCTNLRVR